MSAGTRVRLYPQPLGYAAPEAVTLSSRLGSLGPGPSDHQLRAILPVAKQMPYEPPGYMPPYAGPCLPPALPDPKGQFDHIPTDAPQFLPVHLFGCVRWTLDVWERYLRRPVTWWHADTHPQLELVALLDWDNAHSGPGFIETGSRPNLMGERPLFCLNFDVVAHETGHAVLFSELGVPAPGALGAEFLGFHEAFSDLTALLAALHFPSVVERLFVQTGGDLYVLNLLNRIGELSGVEQIRVADNTVTMADVAGLRLGADGEWVDPIGMDRNAHALSEPLTGAMFDILVEVFQDGLVARGAIPPRQDPRGWSRSDAERSLGLAPLLHRAPAAFSRAFHAALADARDFLGQCMAHVLRAMQADRLNYDAVASAVIEAAALQGHGRQLAELVEIFLLRGIDPRPARMTGPRSAAAWRRLPYSERVRRVAAAKRGFHGGSGDEGACGCDKGGLLFARAAMTHPHRSRLVSAPAPR